MNKVNISLSDKEKLALTYILGESIEENDNNTTFAQKIKNVAKKGLLTASLVLVLLPKLNALQLTTVTTEYAKCNVGVNINKSRENIELQLKVFLMMTQSGIIKKNKNGTITVCGGKSRSQSDAYARTLRYANICIGMGCSNVGSHTYFNNDTNTYRSEIILKVPSNLNNATFENKQYNTMNKEEFKNKIMEGLKESLNFEDSNTVNEAKSFDPKNNKNHKEAYNSFVKWYNRWKEKLGREEIRGLVKKVTNDALGDNLNMINESRMPGENNDHQAFDLFLWFENTQELWSAYGEWTANCIIKRLKRNQPVLEDNLAKSSIVEKAAMATIKSYNKEFPGTYVSSATRKNLRERIAHKIYEYAMDKWEYEQNNE